MTELEKRKKLLVAESEVYRELLKVELQNFRIYGIRARQKASSYSTYMPLAMAALPIVRTLFSRKRRSGLKRWGSLLYLAWQVYSRLGPFRAAGSRGPVQVSVPESTPENEYLSSAI